MYGNVWARANSDWVLHANAAGIDLTSEEMRSQRLAREKVDTLYSVERFEADRHEATIALNGAVLQMFNHGLSSAGMFLLVGALYRKTHTRDLRRFGGLWDIIPIYGALLIFVSMASLGLPGLNGFVGEYLVVAGSVEFYMPYVLLSMVGLLVTGIYVLKAIQKVLHGPYNTEWAEYDRTHHKLEIDRREILALAPLAVLMLVLGLYPRLILDVINDGVVRFLGG